ncbi:MAG TPA: nucleoside hydrolase-like domain-containing protein [Anaerolineaceae bacterium]
MPVQIHLIDPFPPKKTRLVVLTDITSLTAGLREPDDGQSLVRLLLYSCDLELEGLIASSNLGHGQRIRPELIHEVLDAFDTGSSRRR